MRLSLITFEKRRETNVWFDIFVDVRKYGWEGVFRMQNEKWRDILRGNKRGENLRKGGRYDSESWEQLELWEGEIDERG